MFFNIHLFCMYLCYKEKMWSPQYCKISKNIYCIHNITKVEIYSLVAFFAQWNETKESQKELCFPQILHW